MPPVLCLFLKGSFIELKGESAYSNDLFSALSLCSKFLLLCYLEEEIFFEPAKSLQARVKIPA